MPCTHRFDKQLVPYWPCKYLFVGTFNPSWNFPNSQQAEYFYGRTQHNYFWDLVPELWGQSRMRGGTAENDWIPFLQDKRIGITDIIHEITDADENNPVHVERLKKMRDPDLVKFEQIVWHTDAILRFISESRPMAIFFTTDAPPHKIAVQISVIEQEAQRLQINTARLITPSKNARFTLPGRGQLYNNILNRWSKSIIPFL